MCCKSKFREFYQLFLFEFLLYTPKYFDMQHRSGVAMEIKFSRKFTQKFLLLEKSKAPEIMFKVFISHH